MLLRPTLPWPIMKSPAELSWRLGLTRRDFAIFALYQKVYFLSYLPSDEWGNSYGLPEVPGV